MSEEGEISFIKQKLTLISKKIKQLDIEKNSFRVNNNYSEDIKKFNKVKWLLSRESSDLTRLTMRKELILESKTNLEEEHTNIDSVQIKNLYKKANSFIDNLQTSFENVIKFHNDLISEKLEYITKELPDLEKSIAQSRKTIDKLQNEAKILSGKLEKSGIPKDLEKIVIELTQQSETKGQLEKQSELWAKSEDTLKNISEELNNINLNISNNDNLIQEKITQFNQYFTEISNQLYGESYLLSSSKTEKGYELLVTNLEGNPSTGKKKGQIAAFDFAYIKFADKMEIPCLHFILHDQLENIHDNQLETLINIAGNLNGQYIIPILKDKIPPKLDIDEYIVLSLSQTNMFIQNQIMFHHLSQKRQQLYFAGHGHIETTGDYLLASDATRGDEGLALDDVLVLANESPATNKVIILDSCHAGIAGNPPTRKDNSFRYLIAEGLLVIILHHQKITVTLTQTLPQD